MRDLLSYEKQDCKQEKQESSQESQEKAKEVLTHRIEKEAQEQEEPPQKRRRVYSIFLLIRAAYCRRRVYLRKLFSIKEKIL